MNASTTISPRCTQAHSPDHLDLRQLLVNHHLKGSVRLISENLEHHHGSLKVDGGIAGGRVVADDYDAGSIGHSKSSPLVPAMHVSTRSTRASQDVEHVSRYVLVYFEVEGKDSHAIQAVMSLSAVVS